MALALRVRPPRQLRGDPSAINWTHPLVNGLSYFRLLNAQRGNLPDLILRGTDGAPAPSTNAVFAQGPEGIGLTTNTGTGAWLGVASGNTYTANQTAGSLVVRVTAGSFGPTDAVAHAAFNVGGATFPTGPNLGITKHSDNNWYGGWYSGSDTRATVAATGTFSQGDTFAVGVSWSAAGTLLYVKGQLVATNVSAPSTGSTATGGFVIGNDEGVSAPGAWCHQASQDAVYYVMLWDRALSASEHQFIDAQPYDFLMPTEMEMPALFIASPPPPPAMGGTLAMMGV